MTEARNKALAEQNISIHIPRVGDDSVMDSGLTCVTSFQSTSPVWGMTREDPVTWIPAVISIHIPRVGDDLRVLFHRRDTKHFNPHPPCGG